MCEECKRRARGEHPALELRSYPFARYPRRPLNALAVKRQGERRVRAASALQMPQGSKTRRSRNALATHARRPRYSHARGSRTPNVVA